MRWRAPYEPRVLTPFPSEGSQPWLWVDGAEGFHDAEVWERLAPGRWQWRVAGLSESEWQAALPPSRHDRVVSAAGELTTQIRELGGAGRAAAWAGECLVIGPPTEEVWEDMERRLG